MCCFTGSVKNVRNTRIFARWLPGSGPARQVLAYQMSFSLKKEVAMVLPLPVVPGSGEQAVEFLDLEREADFFSRLKELFPRGGKAAVAPAPRSYGGEPKTLAVVRVGSFDASFVPTQGDFSRLDPRFRFSDKVWRRLPQYQNWGFAVFKLRPDSTTVHPMAFRFPNADPGHGLFFPTVHIHDGKVHATEEFDHTLYCQAPPGRRSPPGWEESERVPSSLGKWYDAGLLDRGSHVFRRMLHGNLPNQDTYA